MNPRSRCTSFSNLALCSTRSLWGGNSRQRWVGWHLDKKQTLSRRPSSSRTLILASDSSCTPYGEHIRRRVPEKTPGSAYRANSSALFRVFLFEQLVLRLDELGTRSAKETAHGQVRTYRLGLAQLVMALLVLFFQHTDFLMKGHKLRLDILWEIFPTNYPLEIAKPVPSIASLIGASVANVPEVTLPGQHPLANVNAIPL